MPYKQHSGQCHCGAIKFTVDAPEKIKVQRCNCSICTMTGFVHLIVPKQQFHLLEGEDNLSCYRFNTGVAKHTFSKTCGVKAFYTPRSNPDGISVNLNCIEQSGFEQISIEDFDGKNWERYGSLLAHLSQEPKP